jgi:hypothetical protein
MTKVLIDKVPAPATCNRCGAFVLAALSGGRDVAVDPVVANFSTMVVLVRLGRQVFKLRTYTDGRPAGLDRVTPTMVEYDKARAWSYVVAHGCGCHPQDVTPIAVEQADPQPTCMGYLFEGWAQPLECPAREDKRILGCGLCEEPPF